MKYKNNIQKKEIDSSKKNHADPVLWKFQSNGIFDIEFLGRIGRPGWDIQCAANIIKNLDIPLDYNIAGFNDITHYENEQAIVRAYTGEEILTKKWLLVKYVKFQKDQPYFLMKDLIRDFSSQEIRYMLLSTNYNSEIHFDNQYINACKKNITSLNSFYKTLNEYTHTNEFSKENN